MKILVLMKYVPDTEIKVKLKDDGTLDQSAFRYTINPYDEFAIEEAVALSEKHSGTETLAVTIGPKGAQESLRKAMAMGIERGILISNEGLSSYDSLQVAQVLAAIVEKEKPDLVLGGQRGIDGDNGHVIGLVAELTGRSHVQVVTRVELGEGFVIVEREVEGGSLERLKAKLPSVLGAHKSLNKPRFANLPNIMKAKKKPLDEMSLSDLGVDLLPSAVSVVSYQLPAEKAPAVVYRDQEPKEMVNSLVNDLKQKAKVI